MRIGGSNLIGSKARVNKIGYWVNDELFALIFGFSLSSSRLDFKSKNESKDFLMDLKKYLAAISRMCF